MKRFRFLNPFPTFPQHSLAGRVVPLWARSAYGKDGAPASGLMGAVVLMGLTAGARGCGDTATKPDVRRAVQRVQLVPWIEVNSSTPEAIAHAVDGLLIWKRITDQVIVSTIPGHADLYPVLRQRVPGLHIIPGLKTNDLLPRFDSVEGWKRIAHEVRALCDAAGASRIVMENESAWRDYLKGKAKLDLLQFREGLRRLPKDIQYIWYPSLVGETQAVQQRAMQVCQAVQEVLDVRFTDLSRCGPRSVNYRRGILARHRLAEIARRPLVPMLYCYGPGSRWWQDEDIPQALTHTPEGWVILYPGQKRWSQAARSLTRILKEAGRPTTP